MLESMMESEKGIKITNALKLKIEQYRKEEHDREFKYDKPTNAQSHIVKKLLYNVFFRPHDAEESYNKGSISEFLECRDIRLRMKELIDEASESEIVEEDSLSVNTSDADRIESEYYIDDAINEKAQEINQKFEKRIKHMTQTMYERVKNSPKLEKRLNAKRKYEEAFEDNQYKNDINHKIYDSLSKDRFLRRAKYRQEYDNNMESSIINPRLQYMKRSRRDRESRAMRRDSRYGSQLDNDRRRRHNELKRQANAILQRENLSHNQTPLISSKTFIFDNLDSNEIEIHSKRILGQDAYSSSDEDEDDE